MIVSGDYGANDGSKVELLRKNGHHYCFLPDLKVFIYPIFNSIFSVQLCQAWRSTHTMDGLTVCGGYSSPSVIKTCEVLRNREWIVYEDVLNIPRKGHNSWLLPDGKVQLMNGPSWQGKFEVFDPHVGTTQITASVEHITR